MQNSSTLSILPIQWSIYSSLSVSFFSSVILEMRLKELNWRKFHKLVLIHPGHKCWHQVLFKWPQNALRPVVRVHSMHSCCRSTRKKRDRCNSPSEEGDRSPSHSSSCLWWWWTIRVDCVIHLQSRVMGPPSASQLQNGKPVSKIWQHVRLTHRSVNGPTKF